MIYLDKANPFFLPSSQIHFLPFPSPPIFTTIKVYPYRLLIILNPQLAPFRLLIFTTSN